jgi:hypothetical protein
MVAGGTTVIILQTEDTYMCQCKVLSNLSGRALTITKIIFSLKPKMGQNKNQAPHFEMTTWTTAITIPCCVLLIHCGSSLHVSPSEYTSYGP